MEPVVLLVDPTESSMAVLASRLRMQGFVVIESSTASDGARLALSEPPAVVVADLWMPSISGVQLCRLLKAEPGTDTVPVILRGPEGQRNRFWAERAGAAAYVAKGRMGDLVRAISTAIASAPPLPDFVTHFPGDENYVRDRIAANLDQALFDSVLASEVRALGTCGEFARLFDLFSQFVCQVTSYRWLALTTLKPQQRLGLHCNPERRTDAEREARAALDLEGPTLMVPVEDEDAFDDVEGPPPIVHPIELGNVLLGHLALAVREPSSDQDSRFVEVLARELAGPVRMATLVEESQRLARVDPLTGLVNRRAFRESLDIELARAVRHGLPLTAMLFDIDHFKHVNDQYGHATGDAVLAATGSLLLSRARRGDIVARWGGEEFVVALYAADSESGRLLAERFRQAMTELVVKDPNGAVIPISASFGVAQLAPGDTVDVWIDRADHAMYEAKAGGRNRVVIAGPPAVFAPPGLRAVGE